MSAVTKDPKKIKSYREPSAIENPVAFVHYYLRTQGKRKLNRGETLAKLVQMGVNPFTARTQYQRWFKAKQDAAVAKKRSLGRTQSPAQKRSRNGGDPRASL